MRLHGKVALVTGASSGIGRAIVERFASEGAHVAINYRDHGNKRAVVEGIVAELATPGMAVAADVRHRPEVEAMVQQVIERFGRIDIVVNNAGIEIKKPFLEVADDEWHRVIDINLYGPFLVSQVVARQMVRQGNGGKIVNISSVHEDIPFPDHAPYCAAKGGLRMLARNLAVELARHRINVNNIAPGAIATPINQAVLDDAKAKNNAIGEIPWGRFGLPKEVAAVALFLASDEAEYVTGSTYYVDGGLTQQVTNY